MRRDAWWIQPVVVFVILTSFVAYATWAAFQNAHYEYGNYLSPFYSPLLLGDSPNAWFGPKPGWWPHLLPFSPALIILPFPAGFRFTCYYYRGAYYKAFWADPPSCTVGEPRKGYRGESSFPLIVQNVHRLFLYFALIFLVFLSHDAWKAMWFTDPATGAEHFG
ncbi:MAG: succinate dehydrogenase, partial [Gemmatimonas sp.]